MSQFQRALISVSDKNHLIPLAKTLTEHHVEILSTGGTAHHLRDNGIPVTEVSEHTQFPELFGGRIKTLHPKIHGGILARRGTDDDTMKQHGIPAIDLVIVNLYPFQDTIAKAGCTEEEAIEKIDIGGPAMLRAAAKNHAAVTVVVDPTDYAFIAERIEKTQPLEHSERKQLALKAFAHTASYDSAISAYLQQQCFDHPFQENFTFNMKRHSTLRYGENPHQKAAVYTTSPETASLITATQHQGKALSFNNLADGDTAWQCVEGLSKQKAGCVIVKHANPCGIAQGETPLEAYKKAFSGDPVSAFGGIIAFNHTIDEDCASAIIDNQFLEVLIAPHFTDGALNALQKKKQVRVLSTASHTSSERALHIQTIKGGVLLQETDSFNPLGHYNVVTKKQPTQALIESAHLAWHAVSYVKSNAIVYANHQQTLGIGAGQMSRVDSVRIGIEKAQQAGLSLEGSIMASDAFFPFRDSLDTAAQHGISLIVQPGGSIHDEKIIAAADELELCMLFTGQRHFRH